nr:MAG TPA: hypothetical protein [Caudoviricetes sp.]DAJ49959.1 MAG TPA: hypothetical protein [Caudoviricetes sp.]
MKFSECQYVFRIYFTFSECMIVIKKTSYKRIMSFLSLFYSHSGKQKQMYIYIP